MVGRRREPVSRRRWLGAHLIIFGAWLPWLLALIMHWLASALPRATLTHYATLDETIGALVQYSSGSAALLQERRPLEAAAALAGAALLALAWLGGARRRELRITLGMAGLIFAGPALASAATGLWLFVPHFMIFLLPAVFVALAAGVRWAWASGGPGAAGTMRRAGQAVALAALLVWLGDARPGAWRCTTATRRTAWTACRTWRRRWPASANPATW